MWMLRAQSATGLSLEVFEDPTTRVASVEWLMVVLQALAVFSLTETRFVMPTKAPDTPWYSFDFGVLHYIIISTEHAFAPLSPQHNFVVDVRDPYHRRR
jgi:hypothetical protein